MGHAARFVNNFSIHGNDLNGIAIKDAMREEQPGRRDELYIRATRPTATQLFHRRAGHGPVMVPWITWRYGMQGILYWDMKHWSEVKSPGLTRSLS